MIVLGISIAFLHLLRSEGHKVGVGRYEVHGLALGVLFGPFGFLFWRCFPETQRKREIRRAIVSGIAYGMLFVCQLRGSIMRDMNVRDLNFST